jgi:hypothetical protein
VGLQLQGRLAAGYRVVVAFNEDESEADMWSFVPLDPWP